MIVFLYIDILHILFQFLFTFITDKYIHACAYFALYCDYKLFVLCIFLHILHMYFCFLCRSRRNIAYICTNCVTFYCCHCTLQVIIKFDLPSPIYFRCIHCDDRLPLGTIQALYLLGLQSNSSEFPSSLHFLAHKSPYI